MSRIGIAIAAIPLFVACSGSKSTGGGDNISEGGESLGRVVDLVDGLTIQSRDLPAPPSLS